MKDILQIVIVGLTSGGLYALVAMAYNIIFATTGILNFAQGQLLICLLYTSPSPRDRTRSRMPSSA